MIELTIKSQEYYKKCKDINKCNGSEILWSRLEKRGDVILYLLQCMEFYTLDFKNQRSENKIRYLPENHLFLIKLCENTFDNTERTFSISCPFFYESSKKYFYYYNEGEIIPIDYKLINVLKLVIKQVNQDVIYQENNYFLNLQEIIEEIQNENEEAYNNIEKIIIKILFTEILFTRLDIHPDDLVSETHPKFHVDFTVEQNSQFKLGLEKLYTLDEYEELISHERKCYYVKKF